jgi:predicted 3-demethylubiquinone-9 3-methyltransferase (glyoxalase superfamily)
MARIIPHLLCSEKAEEAARFYASLIPDSRVEAVTTLPADTPSGPEGSVQIVEFTLADQPFMAINAGPLDPFNHAISFVIIATPRRRLTVFGSRYRRAALSSTAAGSGIATAWHGRSCPGRSAQ